MSTNNQDNLNSVLDAIKLKESEKAIVGPINSLLRQSFGLRTVGNREETGSSVHDDAIGTTDYLSGIYRIIVPLFSNDHLGEFTSKDGSALWVWRREEDNAKKYARLYENVFGIPCQVEIK